MKIIKLLVIAMVLLTITQKTMAQTATQSVAVLDHIAIYVADLKASTDFYHSLFNLKIDAEPFHDGKHTWFDLGNGAHLHVVQGAKIKVAYAKNDHLCFRVPSVEEFVKMLQTQSIRYENVSGVANTITARVDGVKQIYFQDPDGHWLEVNDAK